MGMELAGILAQQVLIMFLLLAVGAILVKAKKLDGNAIPYLTNILVYAVTPALLIDIYQVELDVGKVWGLGFAFLLAILSHIISILLNRFVFLRGKRGDRARAIQRFTAVYSNAGFIGIPLISASFGAEGTFYCSAYMTVFNVLAWTHGVYELKQDGNFKFNVKNIILNPGVLGTILGLTLYFARIQLPSPIGPAVEYIASMNTPLALVVCGAFMANLDFKKVIKNVRIYWICAIRLLIIPLIVLAVFRLLCVSSWVENGGYIAVISMISTACPTALAACYMAEKYGADGKFGAEMAGITTLLSIVTVPLMALLSTWVLQG